MKVSRCILDSLLLIFTALFAYFLFPYLDTTRPVMIVASIGFGCIWLYRLWVDIRMNALLAGKRPERGAIKEIALLNEEGGIIKTWYIYNMPSVVIGKSTLKTHADVDLRETAYAGLVDPEHALLNFVKDQWFIEDNDSRNGISIEKKGDRQRYSLSKQEPTLVDKGDIIYIANTRLLIR